MIRKPSDKNECIPCIIESHRQTGDIIGVPTEANCAKHETTNAEPQDGVWEVA